MGVEMRRAWDIAIVPGVTVDGLRREKNPQVGGCPSCGGRPRAVPANFSSCCEKPRAGIDYT